MYYIHYNVNIKQKGVCIKHPYQNLLMPQSSPINPCAQLQVKEFAPSLHTPPFLHGLD